nr:uncharacterized protein LOC127303563 [Lolium perenne]
MSRRDSAFLKQHGLHHTAHTLEMEAGVFFQAAHLLELVSQGRWGPAHRYLRSFSALWGDDDGAATRQYTALLDSLAHNSKLAWFACRGDEGGRAASLRKPPFHLFREYPETAEREAMYCSMTSQQARESVDWNDIKLRTLEKAKELLQLRPNLERLPSNRLPRHMPMPQDIVPLGFRGCRRHPRKRVGHKAARDIAYFLVHKRMPPRQKIKHAGASSEAGTPVLDEGIGFDWNKAMGLV